MGKGGRGRMPAPTKGRYSEQVLGMARTLLRPVGGFNTTDGHFTTTKAKLDTQDRLANIEAGLSEKRSDLQGDFIGLQGAMGEDRTSVRRSGLSARERMHDVQDNMGFLGNVAAASSVLGSMFDNVRNLEASAGGQDSATGKFLGKIGNVLGKVRPEQQKAYQHQQKAKGYQDSIQELLDTEKNATPERIKHLEGVRETIGKISQTMQHYGLEQNDVLDEFYDNFSNFWREWPR